MCRGRSAWPLYSSRDPDPLLVLSGFREAVMNAIPLNLKRAIGVGIGLFITVIGSMKEASSGLLQLRSLPSATFRSDMSG